MVSRAEQDVQSFEYIPIYFYAPPFSLDFNMNSTVCVGQNFEFQCRAEPINYGINLTLYRLDPLFTLSSLEDANNHGTGIDFRNTNTRVIQTSTRRKAKSRHLKYKLHSVGMNDTGGYLCVASVPNMHAARWSYMFLQVEDCASLSALASTKPFRERTLEVFTSPSALTFICLLLAILLVTLTALVFLAWRRQQLPLFLFGSKKWSKAANKVVRETNLLYPWSAPPFHNCSHQVAKDATNASTASYVGIRSGGACSRVGRNLQVPAVIIQVDASVTAGGDGGGGGENGGEAEGKPSAYKIPSDPAWEVPRDCIRLGRQIGAGAFGVVFAGVISEPAKVLPGLRRGDPLDRPLCSAQELTVAVKTLRNNFTEQELADLVREMEILKQFEPHPHVIQLYGACTQNGQLQMLVELAPYGNLRDFLMDRRPRAGQKVINQPLSRLSTRHLVSFGLQVARGMDYLTRLNIVHRDLAARNILIGNRFVAKIADFGLTRAVCDYYKKCSDGRLPIKWMAPESIFDRRYTTKSDVWSFGILLWEIFSFGGTPYPTLSAEALLKALQLGFRNEQPLASPSSVYNLMLACWSIDPVARPSFAHLVSSLQQVYDDTSASSSISSASSSSLSSTSSSSSRSSSPTVSTVYLTLNNTITNVNTDSNNGGLHNYNNQGVHTSTVSAPISPSIYESTAPRLPLGEQCPSSSLSGNFQGYQGPLGPPTGGGNSVLVNNCYAEQGQYLQSIHKAFSMHCNYVVPPRSSE
ncbi:Fibroblast growth factor receptor 2 [Echinococcus granulosus]|nr:Fibroblast growth factor receptor 2 [Echinococcus granulosus]